MEFTPIETQEALDAIIKERVDRAKKTAIKETEERYKDYEELKKKAEDSTSLVSERERRIAELEEAQKEHEKEVATLNGTIGALKLDAKKINIANEAGLPLEMASRLTGEDAESLKADAESLKALMGTKGAPPLGATEPPAQGDGTKEALRNMLKGMKE